MVAPADRSVVRGIEEGTKTLLVRANDPQEGELCASIPVKVGGQISVAYDHAPTFKPYNPYEGGADGGDDGIGGLAGPPSTHPLFQDPPLELGWAPRVPLYDAPWDIDGDGEADDFDGDGTPDSLMSLLNSDPEDVATITVTITDVDGNPKMGKLTTLAFQDGKLSVVGDLTRTTGDGGEATYVVVENVEENIDSFNGVVHDQVITLAGRSADEYLAMSPSQQQSSSRRSRKR